MLAEPQRPSEPVDVVQRADRELVRGPLEVSQERPAGDDLGRLRRVLRLADDMQARR